MTAAFDAPIYNSENQIRYEVLTNTRRCISLLKTGIDHDNSVALSYPNISNVNFMERLCVSKWV